MPAIAGNSAFSRVEIEERSDGGVNLFGTVPTPEDLERLRGLVARALGEKRARDTMRPVSVGR